MDASSVPLHSFGPQYQWCSDSDLSSMSSPETLSPAPSMESGLSPSYRQLAQSSPPQPLGTTSSSRSASTRGRRAGNAAGIRSKQRESASEKEKLRMRDLTKALHHLRSYLPPSLVPVGQNLTKIETLRLTIRYISHLSAQLGLDEEALFLQRRRSATTAPGLQGLSPALQPSSRASGADQTAAHTAPGRPACCQVSGRALRRRGNKQLLTTFASLTQMASAEFCMPLVPREYRA